MTSSNANTGALARYQAVNTSAISRPAITDATINSGGLVPRAQPYQFTVRTEDTCGGITFHQFTVKVEATRQKTKNQVATTYAAKNVNMASYQQVYSPGSAIAAKPTTLG